MIAAWVLPMLVFAACGGGAGEDAEEAAEVLAARVLGAEPTDETRDDHECVAASITDSFDDEALAGLAQVPDLDDLDRPSSRRLLQAALSCVPAAQLGS